MAVSGEGATTAPNWPDLLTRLVDRRDLAVDETAWVMNEVMEGRATDAQLAGFLIGMRAKGETTDELEGLVRTMLAHAQPVVVDGASVDVVGTGGDRSHSVNISTMAALVVAATGALVTKHGNRAASSASGSADVLEALGVVIDLPADAVPDVAAEVGIAFLPAQVFHPAFRHAGPVRRELGIPTVFNVLGPLCNPAAPSAMAVGSGDRRLAPVMAGVLARRGVSALVFHGDDGLDEITTTTTTQVWRAVGGQVTHEVLDPRDLGVEPVRAEDLRGADPAFNASVVRDLVAGARGPVRDVVLLNAAAALVALDHVGRDAGDLTPLVPALDQARAAAAQVIDDGSASSVLDRWVAATQARR
jgi:anthranilate phosphoribosyltransferase